MAEPLQRSDSPSGYDHYTEPNDHMIRIETTLSNTAARLYDAAEKHVGPDHKPKDAVTEHLIDAASSISKLQREAVHLWDKGAFKDLDITKRVETGTDLLQAAKNTLSEAETRINKTPHEYGSSHSGALKAIAAQHARLNGVLEEHRERQQIEVPKTAAKTPIELQASATDQFPTALQ